MNKIAGNVLITLGMIGIGFFITYRGTAIPLKELWFVLSLTVAIAGAFILAKNVIRNSKFGAVDDAEFIRVQELKSSGEKVSLTLDNCEVKTRSFVQQIGGDEMPDRAQMIDGIFAPERNYQAQETVQTYIRLQQEYDGRIFNFYSPPVTMGEESLRFYLSEANRIFLYIDRRNPRNYYFDFQNG
ncbi:hypothetical protein [Pinibacter aurantiacus]|uniref:Uncharacterized protein n=1 Tax=Pinibacter aurantiacus TaxID=2851599 RepID=A0A9E2SDK2_9BACT|nr:hypothetical protein [Pinibacter aurantiacus]MBV4359664.1 hypothetical protein [Pinibacter aurantiacus]